MSRIAYVNGRYRPWRAASIAIDDRGYQFADGVYEVCEVRGGRIIDARRHLVRLHRSLAESRIDMPMSDVALTLVMRECIRRNRVDNGILRGITRSVLLEVIKAQGLQLEERPFAVDEAYEAREAFLTSASQIVMPVVRLDDRPIGNGAPGSVATALRAQFHDYAESS